MLQKRQAQRTFRSSLNRLRRAASCVALSIAVFSACAPKHTNEWTFDVKRDAMTSPAFHCWPPIAKGEAPLTDAGGRADVLHAGPTGPNAYLYFLTAADREYVLRRNANAAADLRQALHAFSREHLARREWEVQELLSMAQAFARVGDADEAKILWHRALSIARAPRDDRTALVARGDMKRFFRKISEDDADTIANVKPDVSETGAIIIEQHALNAAAAGNATTAARLLLRARTCGGPWVGPYPNYALGALYLLQRRPQDAWPRLLDATTDVTFASPDIPNLDVTNLRAAQLLLRFYPKGV